MKWLTKPKTEELIESMIKEVLEEDRAKLMNMPSPVFLSNRSSVMVLGSQSNERRTPQTPPRKPFDLSKC